MRSARFRKLIQGLQQQQPEEPYSATLSPTMTAHCRLKLQLTKQIQELYQQPSVFQLLKNFLESTDLPEQVLGKKSAQISISKNQLLCLKAISQQDIMTLQRIFDSYAKHVREQKQNILIPILGTILLLTTHANHSWNDPFIIMPNLQLRGRVLFDIKGHTDNRVVSSSDFEYFGFGKDQNFVKSPHRKLLRQASQQFKDNFLERVQISLNFLRSNRIIDYSLALIFGEKGQEGGQNLRWQDLDGQHVVTYYIIDYLQVYNQRKKLQNKVKSLFFKDISSVDPDTYAERLLNFLKKGLI